MVRSILLIALAVVLFGLGLYNGAQFEVSATYPEKVVLKKMEQESLSPELAAWNKALIKQKEYFQVNRNEMRRANIRVLFPVAIILFIMGLLQLIAKKKKKR